MRRGAAGPVMAGGRQWHALLNRRTGVMAALGFASGLPLALTGGTLQAWLTVSGVRVETIGLFALVGLPYTLKFLWAPAMDRFVPPWLGRRRGWIASSQVLLVAGIGALSLLDPAGEAAWVAALALGVALLSASQDVAFDAYRTDVLRPAERGLGAALTVTGYRLAMLVSGALALVLAEPLGWPTTYRLMAAVMALGVLATLLAPEPERPADAPASLAAAVREPLAEFLSRHGAWLMLAAIIAYKLGDAFAGSLTTTFLIRGVGFSPAEVGVVNKAGGLAATLLGALVGGAVVPWLGLYRALLLFGLAQAATNLGFAVLAMVGHHIGLMATVVVAENLAGGMGTAAFVAWLMGLCDHRYSATQYALLSALAAVGRVFVAPAAGYLVAAIDWPLFFVATTVAALPGLALLRLLRGALRALDRGEIPGHGDRA